jgi:hypothetical protein
MHLLAYCTHFTRLQLLWIVIWNGAESQLDAVTLQSFVYDTVYEHGCLDFTD